MSSKRIYPILPDMFPSDVLFKENVCGEYRLDVAVKSNEPIDWKSTPSRLMDAVRRPGPEKFCTLYPCGELERLCGLRDIKPVMCDL